ncbi:hypothetical protein [Streptomyces sp. 891-h]|uniref:hypothetical protein n=1 Tax=Streptomyces sp. 891-h TaxID=2720714 RepID=UPI001FA99C51|nr:hypothetical protein [Streptomyces sp. 891-h]UNZ20572.1 hypothetical protein HC362_29445 [Streptomyces sp. 891-h]
MSTSSQNPKASGAWALLVNADGSDEWLEQCNAALAEVQEETRAKTLRHAIEQARGEYLTDDTGSDEDRAYNRAVSDVIAAIDALRTGGAR